MHHRCQTRRTRTDRQAKGRLSGRPFVHCNSPRAQLRQSSQGAHRQGCLRYAQIEQALKSAGGSWRNVVQFTTFLVHSQDIAKFYKWREQNYPKMFAEHKFPPNTLLVISIP
jgi:enamine deaminase RidA (YjgF/YER057c/UK114 family)